MDKLKLMKELAEIKIRKRDGDADGDDLLREQEIKRMLTTQERRVLPETKSI
jgi:hypothetical protein